ncbi:MAG: hypothetical protein J5950_00240 [Clostridia bacterium]|nr:hypothetical protein [Clostridia bacterium]MBR5967819.1 hypothetical protein [Lachnospiraceae bacterium]
MAKMTSAYANKVLRKLNEDKEFWRSKEQEGHTYVAALDEEPVIPDYDYAQVAKNIEEIDEQIVKIKHALNVTNCTNEVTVGGRQMTVDTILVKMAQLNRRKAVLDEMRKQQPKTRMNSGLYSTRKTAPEYRYINYDLELIKKEYERIDSEVSEMQIALDKYNQTVEFEVEL